MISIVVPVYNEEKEKKAMPIVEQAKPQLVEEKKGFSFLNSIKKGFEIIILNGKAAEEVALNNKATLHGLIILALAGIANAIGQFNLIGLVLYPIISILGLFAGVGIFHLSAKFFGGKASYMQFFRAASYSSLLFWIMIIPILSLFLSPVLSIWSLVITVIILKAVHKLSTGKAVAAVVVPIIVIIILTILISFIFVGPHLIRTYQAMSQGFGGVGT